VGQNVGQKVGKRAASSVEDKGDGLRLRRRGATATWILRIQTSGRRRDITIGTSTSFTLKEARAEVAKVRAAVARGEDPRSVLNRPTSPRTFGQAVEEYIAASRRRWRSALEEKQTRSQLTTLFKSLLTRPVASIRRDDLLPVLTKAADKPPSYSKLLYRTRGVFTRELALGHIQSQPIPWEGLSHIITPTRRAVVHHPAMPWKDADFAWGLLRDRWTPAACALKLLVLTATRSAEARGARWSEFDLKGAVWTIPPERTKTGKEHEVPLSKQVLALLMAMPRAPGDLLFPGAGKSDCLSDMGLLKEQRLIPGDYTVHGWRSTFRDWGGENEQDIMLLELSLGHAVGSKVERAYARSTLRERRRPLMQAWADFVTGEKR
jgi:integrase